MHFGCTGGIVGRRSSLVASYPVSHPARSCHQDEPQAGVALLGVGGGAKIHSSGQMNKPFAVAHFAQEGRSLPAGPRQGAGFGAGSPSHRGHTRHATAGGRGSKGRTRLKSLCSFTLHPRAPPECARGYRGILSPGRHLVLVTLRLLEMSSSKVRCHQSPGASNFLSV